MKNLIFNFLTPKSHGVFFLRVMLISFLMFGGLIFAANAQTTTQPIDKYKEHNNTIKVMEFVVSKDVCNCADTFYNTTKWTRSKTGTYYCMATSKKSGKQYKRYFSAWLKQHKKKQAKK